MDGSIPTAFQQPYSPVADKNIWGQVYEINKGCYSVTELGGVRAMLKNLINCTPHAINYFNARCQGSAIPAFRINADTADFYNRFRPESKSSLQHYKLPIRIYNQNNYLPLENGTSEHQLLSDLFKMLNKDYPDTIMIMSTIGANYIISAIDSGLITAGPRLKILSPNSGDSVRDSAGNMIGVMSFTVLYSDGTKVPRER